ncbi:MAG: hypothetical protein BAJALOKI3v1_1400001 [Promethearchaeota archaeon]|nr:MAG: hypothetical protein BAJALOKI3v1_1400001 [Candidatus Lokiarchaeota archaeon]
MGERLLAIHVFAHAEGHGRGRGVRMVGRRDEDAVDLALHLAKHRAEIGVAFGLGVRLGGLGEVPLVDVAEGDDVLAPHAAQVRTAPSGDADNGDGESAVRGLPGRAGGEDKRCGEDRPRGGGRAPQKSAAGKAE